MTLVELDLGPTSGAADFRFWPLAVHQLKCSDVGFRAESGTR